MKCGVKSPHECHKSFCHWRRRRAGRLAALRLGLWLNPLLPTVPLGTLAANLIGGYLVGAAVAVFHFNASNCRRSSSSSSSPASSAR
jgi:hypothetical protein